MLRREGGYFHSQNFKDFSDSVAGGCPPARPQPPGVFVFSDFEFSESEGWAAKVSAPTFGGPILAVSDVDQVALLCLELETTSAVTHVLVMLAHLRGTCTFRSEVVLTHAGTRF